MTHIKSVSHTHCSYCYAVNGGHTLACSAIHGDQKPAQIPIPLDAPYWKRLRKEAVLNASLSDET